MDKFYTPLHIAANLPSYVTLHEPSVIADFCAGNGQLLQFASSIWPQAKILATDYDIASTNYLRNSFPGWLIGKCDFLDNKSRRRCKVLKMYDKKISLVLLNPPFTCRGGTKHVINIDNKELTCSTAMAFLCTSTSYIDDSSEILAILPSGCLNNEKDIDAWKFLRSRFAVTVIDEYHNRTFVSCNPTTTLVKLKKLSQIQAQLTEVNGIAPTTATLKKYSVVRGSLSIPDVVQQHDIRTPNSIPLIHTTDLNNGVRIKNYIYTCHARRIINGPAVLLPRIGLPKVSKICCYKDVSPITLSDCVIAVMCSSTIEAEWLANYLKDNIHLLRSQYNGTCAKYITLSLLNPILLTAEAFFNQIINVKMQYAS